MTTLYCDDCEHICTEDDLEVEYPEIPRLSERVAPGEPTPYGECPECGALIHKITPKPGLRGWLAINDGKFEAQCPFDCHRPPDLITDDPDAVREFFTRARVDNISCSSSVDFPEESGMLREKVDLLFGREPGPGYYHEPQEKCPKCGSDNIANEGPPEDGALFVTCHDCSMQWHEWSDEDEGGDA